MSDEAPESGTRVLLVEDEESFVDALAIGLEREGFAVTVARDGIEALRLFELDPPQLVLLDLMLPKLSGVDVCRAIRSRSAVPIIMVTAKAAEIDTVVGLEVGADDYVTKPYRLRELVSRMRAVLRRVPNSASAESQDREHKPTVSEGALRPEPVSLVESTADVLEVGEVRLDPSRHECLVRGEEVRLPPKEFELLELLLANAGHVITRDRLIDRVWGIDYVGDTKTLDVHVKRLRSKIEETPSSPRLITTIRGLGYRFERPKPASR